MPSRLTMAKQPKNAASKRAARVRTPQARAAVSAVTPNMVAPAAKFIRSAGVMRGSVVDAAVGVPATSKDDRGALDPRWLATRRTRCVRTVSAIPAHAIG
jgi:hypothetical protein